MVFKADPYLFEFPTGAGGLSRGMGNQNRLPILTSNL